MQVKVVYLLSGLITLSAIAFAVHHFSPWRTRGPADVVKEDRTEATGAQIQQFCGYCHKPPPPSVLPKYAWKKQIQDMYYFFHGSSHAHKEIPKFEQVVRYFENRAPEELDFGQPDPSRTDLPLVFRRADFTLPHQDPQTRVSNVNLVRLRNKTPENKLDVLTCDMKNGWVTVFKPYDPQASITVGKVAHPAHAEVVDLDRDGIDDVIVADLGHFFPTDDRKGQVVWFKGNADGTFTPHTLLKDVGRVADVQAADFNEDGKLDLVVAVFGWHKVGEIIYLENRTVDANNPVFKPHILDERHGAIHVPVTDYQGKRIDLNGDGHRDFVALISQEHEAIVAFLGDGKGKFRKENIFEAPDPSYGSSGIQMVDLNNDGKLDVLYTNGDVMDTGRKPWHSVQWLENEGKYPFKHHPITRLHGVHRAVAVDLDGRGLLDIFAVSFLPMPEPSDSIILLKQETPGKFARYVLEKGNSTHANCAVGDLDGNGKMDLVTGHFAFQDERKNVPALNVWRNLGRLRKGQ